MEIATTTEFQLIYPGLRLAQALGDARGLQ